MTEPRPPPPRRTGRPHGPHQFNELTLTTLYNQRSTRIAHAYAALDRAVWSAYGWDDPDPAAVTDETILERLLALNGERAGNA